MYGDAFKGLFDAVKALMVVAAVSVPLAIWKLIDIAIWFFSHIRWE